MMSATFPNIIKNRLENVLGSYTPINATPEIFFKFQRHELNLIDDDLCSDSGLSNIIENALRGNSVLICCNTVKRAQQVYDEIRPKLKTIETVLLLGRFNGLDRNFKEDAVKTATGVNRKIIGR
jgi:CRISPR-associated endonuclease/helicase Cas3